MVKISASWAKMKRRKTLLFYCQHSVGIGHLIRSFAVAQALSRGFRVVFVSGGKLPGTLSVPDQIEYVQIPPVGVGDDGALISQDRRRAIEDALCLRRKRLLDLFRELKPAVLLIEFYPFGRMHFSGELLPLLDAARRAERSSRPLVLCSVRDILERKRKYQQVQDDLACTLVNTLYDGVLFHADARFARLEETFQSFVPLTTPVYYTGFVSPHREQGAKAAQTRPEVIVSAGGGRCGGALMRAALEAYARHGIGQGIGMTLVTGPFIPQADWDALKASAAGIRGLRVRRWLSDFRGELARAAISVSQCGYNTTMDLLCARVPALVVPFVTSGDGEQMHRARKLERLGTVRLLEPERASAENLAAEIRQTLKFRPSVTEFDLNGVSNTSKLIESLVYR